MSDILCSRCGCKHYHVGCPEEQYCSHNCRMLVQDERSRSAKSLQFAEEQRQRYLGRFPPPTTEPPLPPPPRPSIPAIQAAAVSAIKDFLNDKIDQVTLEEQLDASRKIALSIQSAAEPARTADKSELRLSFYTSGVQNPDFKFPSYVYLNGIQYIRSDLHPPETNQSVAGAS